MIIPTFPNRYRYGFVVDLSLILWVVAAGSNARNMSLRQGSLRQLASTGEVTRPTVQVGPAPTTAPTITPTSPAPTEQPTTASTAATTAPSTESPTKLNTEEPTLTPTISPEEPPEESVADNFMDVCFESLQESDLDENQQWNLVEYILFLDSLCTNWEAAEFLKIQGGYPFEALPEALRTNFNVWQDEETGTIHLELPEKKKKSINVILRGQPKTQRNKGTTTATDFCETTQTALEAALESPSPAPTRLIISTPFLAVHPNDFNSTIDNATEYLLPAMVLFVEDYVPGATDAILLESLESDAPTSNPSLSPSISDTRQRQRYLNNNDNPYQYWILATTTKLKQETSTFNEEDCSSRFLEDANLVETSSCFSATLEYQILVLQDDNSTDDMDYSSLIAAAAERANQEEIDQQSLWKSLQRTYPKDDYGASEWAFFPLVEQSLAPTITPPTAVPVTLPPKTESPVETFPIDNNYNNIDEPPEEEYIETVVVVGTNGTMPGNNMCGGDLGEEQLAMLGQDCDSFAGRHFWHIIVIVGLAAFLLVVFCPLLVCGRYPCCDGFRKSKAHRVRATTRPSMKRSMSDLDLFQPQPPPPEPEPKQTRKEKKKEKRRKKKQQKQEEAELKAAYQSGRTPPRRAQSFDGTAPLAAPTRKTPRRSQSHDGAFPNEKPTRRGWLRGNKSTSFAGRTNSTSSISTSGTAGAAPTSTRRLPRRSKSLDLDHAFAQRLQKQLNGADAEADKNRPGPPRRRKSSSSLFGDRNFSREKFGEQFRQHKKSAAPPKRLPRRSKSFDDTSAPRAPPPRQRSFSGMFTGGKHKKDQPSHSGKEDPGKMSVHDIKEELDGYGIPYVDCFEKAQLVDRLIGARMLRDNSTSAQEKAIAPTPARRAPHRSKSFGSFVQRDQDFAQGLQDQSSQQDREASNRKKPRRGRSNNISREEFKEQYRQHKMASMTGAAPASRLPRRSKSFDGPSSRAFEGTSTRAPPPKQRSFSGVQGEKNQQTGSEREEPERMSIREIKAELMAYGIPYADCFEKAQLVARLTDARRLRGH